MNLVEILETVDLTYRNSFSSNQKIQWMDAVQRQIFQLVPKEAQPFSFKTVSGQKLYSLPSNCDRFGIKTVTISSGKNTSNFSTLPYLSVESSVGVGAGSYFYTLLDDQIFLNPTPTDSTAGRTVYILYNRRPTPLTPLNDSAVPDLEEDFHELLVLGCLERIARARGEVEDKNNFAVDFNLLLDQYRKLYKLRQPEYYSPKDVMPSQGYLGRKGRGRGRWNRSSAVSDLIPPNN